MLAAGGGGGAGEAWAELPHHRLPCPRATSPSPALPRSREATLCLQQWLAGWGGFAPCSFVRVVGRGEALHLIILRIFLCCGCHYCSAQTLPASSLWGKTEWRGLNQGWDTSVSPWLWEGWQKTVCPACPAWSINSPASHERGWAPPVLNRVLPAAQDVCIPFPFIRAAEGLVRAQSSPALALVLQPSLCFYCQRSWFWFSVPSRWC